MPFVFGFITSPIGWVVLALVAFLLFGNRLPTVMRSLGKGVVEFKKGIEGIEDDVDHSAKKIDGDHPAKNVESEPAQK
jgi:sec-independent protein translocase protein TatA